MFDILVLAESGKVMEQQCETIVTFVLGNDGWRVLWGTVRCLEVYHAVLDT